MHSLPTVPTVAGIPTDLSTIDYVDAYRAFNQIGGKALKVLPTEMVNFVNYVDAFCETLRRHCEGENTIIFPRLSSFTALDGEDNKALLGCLERMEQWVHEAAQHPEKADSVELVAAMEVMAPVFSSNMHEQVRKPHEPPALKSALTGPELRALVDEDIAWIAQNSRMEYFLPFLVLHHDRSANEAWPGLPDEAKNALPELMAANPECWHYAPFDLAGQLQN
ncbi:hypothetical protein RhiXN_07130 [Rhizoctonia solani]|uniref:Hemerythrin-like domain-containing protein n=1 Tax=Rhizoctonia solani TaxID=456999 RepID=A0A8H8T0A4_9AGAM|nr:uncharacterized protein RhiXN_07130 [Rhizoctonia solani]QRW25181.1 hypothetical protein RhiXN_07130 [Rhizoctonia solani]